MTRRIHISTQDSMEMSLNNGTSIVPNVKGHLEPQDDFSGVCADQSAYTNNVSVSEEEFY